MNDLECHSRSWEMACIRWATYHDMLVRSVALLIIDAIGFKLCMYESLSMLFVLLCCIV